MTKIVLTGGGTAGHVMPNIALMEVLRSEGWDIRYIGSAGMEKDIIAREEDVTYYTVSAGKLRRYVDLKNISDPFKVLKGYFQARRILRKLKPDVLFSKGGFVSVPVVVAAKHLGIPAVIHESDMTPGLANRLSIPCAEKVCCTFSETMAHVGEKGVLTGTPIRSGLFAGDASRARALYGLDAKPVILVIGGSLGATVINNTVREILPKLIEKFNIVHICGKGNLAEIEMPGYVQLEFVSDGLSDLFALADAVISRAGANSIFEFLALRKPMLLIPLSRAQSRGDQCDNAESFRKKGHAMVLEQESMDAGSLYTAVLDLYEHRAEMIAAMERTENTRTGTGNVMNVIRSVMKK